MNKKLLPLVILLTLVILTICFIKLLKSKNIETFKYDDPTQKQTDAIIQPTKVKIDDNSKSIDKTGELLINRKEEILSDLENTQKNLKANKDKINNMIVDFDVLKNYHTVLDNDTKERTVKQIYKGKKCLDSNLDLSGSVQGYDAIKICAKNCNSNNNCVSFNYDKNENKCQLSSICSLNNTQNNDDFDLYFKKTADPNSPLTDYILYQNSKCKKTSTILEENPFNLKDCAQVCSDNPKCISFDYNTDTSKCNLTTDCYNENSLDSDNYNLYQKKDIKVHKYINTINIPHNKKNRIILHKFYNDFCIDNDGTSAKLKKCTAKGDNDKQTFVYNKNGYLENSEGKCLYYNDSGSGPQNGKHIKLAKCPTQVKDNFKWKFKKNKGGHHDNTLSIVSGLKNRSTGDEYSIDANSGTKWLKYNGLVNDIHNNNNSQLTLTNYKKSNKNNWNTSIWFRDFF